MCVSNPSLVPINLKFYFFTFVLVLPTRFLTQYDPMTLHTYSKGQPKGQQFCCHNSIQLYQRSLRVVYVVGYGLRSLLVEVLYVTLKRDLLHCVKRPSGYFADQTKCSKNFKKCNLGSSSHSWAKSKFLKKNSTESLALRDFNN